MSCSILKPNKPSCFSCPGQLLTGVAGSPAYAASDLLSGSYSEKVDIWSAGVLLHAILLGVHPFKGDSLEEVFEAIKSVELNFHTGVWEPISELVRDLIGRMLTRDASARITAAEVSTHGFCSTLRGPSKALSMKLKGRDNTAPQVQLKRVTASSGSFLVGSSSLASSRRKSEEPDRDFADALAAAISRIRISEPKRSRLYTAASPIQQQCYSNMNANLLAAFEKANSQHLTQHNLCNKIGLAD